MIPDGKIQLLQTNFHTSAEYIHNVSCMKESWKKPQME